MIKAAWEMRLTILAALLAGFFLSPFDGVFMSAYDWARPVVSMQGEIIERSGDSVTLHIWGTKNRECKYIDVLSFSRTSKGIRRDTEIVRTDQASQGKTKPVGTYDIGNWRIRPIIGADAVSVYVQHDCDGRVILTKMAEVML